MPIHIVCPSCAGKLRAPESAAGGKVKCPKCGAAIVVARPSPNTHQAAIQTTMAALAASYRARYATLQLDIHTKIAAFVALVGLLILGISPFFSWINFASGGIIGLKGGGKIVLGITVLAMALFIAAFIKQKWLTPVVLAVQGWGTLAVFWMGALVWGVGSIFDSPDIRNNPFAGLFATQIGPGAGLYLGLIGALGVAAALGFVAVRRLLTSGKIKLYYATQGLSLVLGILLAFFVGPDRPSEGESGQHEKAADQETAQEEWRTAHNVSDRQWDNMIANYKARKRPETVGESDWWEEAKDKTPAELNKLYPPLQPREWYRAEWVGDSFSGSRELDYGVFDRSRTLNVEVTIRTEPDVPIKEIHGHLAFVKDNQIVYETDLAEKPEVSFTDYHFVFLRIPYDDSNANHRTLRFAKDDELTPVFTVTKVVLANGTEKTFQ